MRALGLRQPCLNVSQALFHNDNVVLEHYYSNARHIEVQVQCLCLTANSLFTQEQIFGNGRGKVTHMGERECSLQRRHQKVIEESPSPFLAHRKGLYRVKYFEVGLLGL
jgi:urea carboxylase